MTKKSKLLGILFIIFLTLSWTTESIGCSIFRVMAKDGTIVSGRTYEFGLDFKNAVIIVPRNKTFLSPAPDDSEGIKWKTKYGYVAVNVFGNEAAISDGLNEAGLSFGWLWYESDMEWQTAGPKEKPLALAHFMFGSWVLGNFSSVEEAVKEIRKVKVFGYKNPR